MVVAVVVLGCLPGCSTLAGQSVGRTLSGGDATNSNLVSATFGPGAGLAVLGVAGVMNLVSDLKTPSPGIPQDTSWMDDECAKVNPQNGQIDRSGCK